MNTVMITEKNRRHAGLKERYVYPMVDLTFGQRRGVIKNSATLQPIHTVCDESLWFNVGPALPNAFIGQGTFSSLLIQLEIDAR